MIYISIDPIGCIANETIAVYRGSSYLNINHRDIGDYILLRAMKGEDIKILDMKKDKQNGKLTD